MSEELEKREEKVETKETATGNSKGFRIASLVLGIVSLVIFCIWYLSIPCAILAIVFSVLAKKKSGKSGMTTAGLVLGIVTLAILAVVLFLGIIGVSTMLNSGVFDQIERDTTSYSSSYRY